MKKAGGLRLEGFFACVFIVASAACGGGATAPDASFDGAQDGSNPSDASAPSDGSQDAARDAGTKDEGTSDDSGFDSSAPSDGPQDAETDAGADAGSDVVGGVYGGAFGVFAVFTDEFKDFGDSMGFDTLSEYQDWAGEKMKDLGATWTRSNLQLVWDLVEPEVGDPFDWTASRRGEDVFAGAARHGVNYLVVFHEGSGPGSKADPRHPMLRNPLDNIEAYRRFVGAAVERYDGDGVDDNPSGIVIKHWQAGNETPGWTESGRDADDYVTWFSAIAEAAREADPEARLVVIASTNANQGDPLHQQVIAKLASAGVRFDAIDLHHWGAAGDYEMKAVPEYRSALTGLGLDDVELWSCEHGTFVGTPKDQPGQCTPQCGQGEVCVPGLGICKAKCASDAQCPPARPQCDTSTGLCAYAEQTQADQARSLVYRYVVNRAAGVRRIMWNNLAAWRCFAGLCGGYFDLLGLVADGFGPGETAADVGKPRLAYHTYKMLAERTDESVAEQLGDAGFGGAGVNAYAYRNLADGKYGLVVWLDAPAAVTFEFEGSKASVVSFITDAKGVPLRNETVEVADGSLALSLDENPVWITEAQ
jgi:hypothetical protein